jgi:hypothetical protein
MAVLAPSHPYTIKQLIATPAAVNNLGVQSHATRVLVVVRAKIQLAQAAIPAAANADVQLIRKTAAPTGTSAVTPSELNPGDAVGFTAAHTSTGNGTDGDIITGEGWGSSTGWTWDWAPTPEEYVVVPAGTANGLWIKTITAPPAGSYEFTMVVHEIG